MGRRPPAEVPPDVIPHRIQLTGFLSYKDGQEVRFDDAPLWMLTGTNGSGKSSVFDAVTYALFGHHRGGNQNAAELINKESASLSVEFDFRLDGHLFRIKRTLRKNARGVVAGTQQIFRHLGGGDWEAVPDTSKKVDFDRWVHERIGLNYETFTSSVLLLQGRAEKLLDARPSGRAEVLAGIVDLERYQRLHEKANARKLELKARLEALSHQADAVPDVSDLELLAAANKIGECEEARQLAQAAADAAVRVEMQAGRWADLQARLHAARQRLAQAEGLLGEAVRIEKQVTRLRELRDVLPAVNTVVTMRGQFQESERKTLRLLKEKQDATARKEQAEHSQNQAKQKRASLQKKLTADEARLSDVNARLRELAGVLKTVEQAERLEAELKRHEAELAKLPARPEEAVEQAHREVERLTKLAQSTLPLLELFQTDRHDLGVARQAAEATQAEFDRVQKEGTARKAEFEKLQPEAAAARQALTAAEQRVAAARALADQAALAADEFARLTGAKTCSACGQALTKEHYALEKARRQQAASAADREFKAAVDARQAAADQAAELTDREKALGEKLTELRVAYKEQATLQKQYAAEVKRLTDVLALRYAQLPPDHQRKVSPTPPADWTATSYPERDELVALRREAGGLEAAKQRKRDTEAVAARVQGLRAKADAARQALAHLRADLPPGDLSGLRQEYATLQAEEAAVVNAVRAGKLAITAAETEVDKLGREAHEAVQLITDAAGKLHTEEVTRKHCTDAADRALSHLPPAWKTLTAHAGLTEYHAWKSELDELAAGGAEDKFNRLEQARGGLAALRQDIADLTTQADSFPPDARRTPEEAKALVAAARAEVESREKALRDAQREKAVLDGHREQRAKLGEQVKRLDAGHTRYKQLSELLGRDRLQRHLVRQAERQIVDYANAVLDRLSGGQLFLRLVGGEDGAGADRALELECSNRVTGGAPINVAFLSGSQRFRVAVSLALAIGQYASRQHRPIESVIIDEGFGCLDRQGRQVMIQELQNLRGHLHCILLVSHQEEFADAFSDGYRFELHDGATRVSRFRR
jgi:DNA repair exonuclease SbcCD ATPase subunit